VLNSSATSGVYASLELFAAHFLSVGCLAQHMNSRLFGNIKPALVTCRQPSAPSVSVPKSGGADGPVVFAAHFLCGGCLAQHMNSRSFGNMKPALVTSRQPSALSVCVPSEHNKRCGPSPRRAGQDHEKDLYDKKLHYVGLLKSLSIHSCL
jgi:hypothetical protein